MSDTGRNKTVVTAISKISDRPVAKEACLVVIYGLELGKKFNLNRPQIIIGRSSKADIQIDQEAVSRNHCKIINTGNAIMLRDMGSTNGTYVNDEMIDEYVLRDGDFIKVSISEVKPSSTSAAHKGAAPAINAPAINDRIKCRFMRGH